MISFIRFFVYVAALVALWRLWSANHMILWWATLAAAILTAWTAATIRTAYRQAIAELAPRDEADAVLADEEAKANDVVHFWVRVNMAVTAVTFVLSVVGIVMSFRG